MVEESSDPSVAEDLDGLDDALQAGRDFKRDDQPEGIFQAEIADATYGRAQSSDRRQITWELVIIAGPHKAKTVYKYDGLETPQQTSITMNGMRNLGVDTTKLTSKTLPAILVSLKGKKATIRCKQKGDFYNINFQRAITVPKTSSGSGGGGKSKTQSGKL